MLWPGPLRGKVINTVFAAGNLAYCAVSVDDGSKVKGMVLSWPLRVVAAYVIEWDWRRGIRKVDVQPAPRMRMSTDEGGEVVGGEGGVVSCVIYFCGVGAMWGLGIS